MDATIVGTKYDAEACNCAHTVFDYYKNKGCSSTPQGDLIEYTREALLWIKRNFKQAKELKNGMLILAKNSDGTLHAAIYDNHEVLHNSGMWGMVVREPLFSFKHYNKHLRYFEWQQ